MQEGNENQILKQKRTVAKGRGGGERKKGFLIEFRKLIAAEFITNYARNKLKVA